MWFLVHQSIFRRKQLLGRSWRLWSQGQFGAHGHSQVESGGDGGHVDEAEVETDRETT